MNNLISKVLVLAVVFGLLLPSHAAASDKWFGYFANNDKVHENYDHTNITFVWAGYATTAAAKPHIMAQLAQAEQYGLKAIVDVGVFVFNVGVSGPVAECPFSINTGAASSFGDLVDDLISEGYLVPGNPQASVVAAFYPIDEPELCGLKDQAGLPHAALVNAVDVIRGNPNTYNFPLFSIGSKKYDDAIKGYNLLDWVGMQNYSANTSAYIADFSSFEGKITAGRRTVLVPQASQGGMMSSYGTPHDPQLVLDKFLSSSKVIGMMPFLWYHADTTGVSGIPSLRTQYEMIGDHVANGVPLPMKGGINCHGGGGLFECFANISRGLPPYTYTWSPVPSLGQGGNSAVFMLPCGITHLFNVTVTDSFSQTLSRTISAYCAPGSQPVGFPVELEDQ